MKKFTIAQIKEVIEEAVEYQDREDLCPTGKEIYDKLCEIVGRPQETLVDFLIEEFTLDSACDEGDLIDGKLIINNKTYNVTLTVNRKYD